MILPTLCSRGVCSQKSSRDSTPMTQQGGSSTSQQGTGSGSGVDPGLTYSGSGSGSTGSGSGQTMVADGSWLAGLAMGDSPRTVSPSSLQSALIALAALFIITTLSSNILNL